MQLGGTPENPNMRGARQGSPAPPSAEPAPRPIAPEPFPRLPFEPPFHRRVVRALRSAELWVVRWFSTHEPRFRHVLLPLLLLASVLFVRHPSTNYIFDEQEALLANPYINAAQDLTYLDAIHRDFWGLPPTASIGSYRPLPNFLWRATWQITTHPFFHHLYNILIHALNGALLASFVFAVTRRRMLSWLAGTVFVSAAVLTEAVSGIVGIADVLGGLGAILALSALRLPAWGMVLGVFGALSVGLFSKESALVCVPLVPLAALLTAPMLHPSRPARVARALLALVAAAGAFVLYVELRKAWFPSPLPSALQEPLPADAGDLQLLYRELLVWFHQAPLPRDELNNPLVEADFPHRVAGALRVYWRGLSQVIAPVTLSGDYSFPQEPIPESLWEWESIAGGVMMVLPLLGAVPLYLLALFREHRDHRRLVSGELASALTRPGAAPPALAVAPMVELPARPFRRRHLAAAAVVAMAGLSGLATELWLLSKGGASFVKTWPASVALLLIAAGLVVEGWRSPPRAMAPAGAWPWRHVTPLLLALGGVWLVVSYFPHSNIPVLLPTVRAERFWYFPVIGTSLVVAMVLARLAERLRGKRILRVSLAPLLVCAFLGFQWMQAYGHSMDYRDDLSFWDATRHAVPRSAKAHLNYSVMVGARNDLPKRLAASRKAMALAPEWPMAHVYTGDTLCRMHRPHEAWPHYARGFALDANARSLIALALQCLHDEKALLRYDKELRAMSDDHPGSWLAYLAIDTLENHEKNDGVDPEYRPRGYNQGPKED